MKRFIGAVVLCVTLLVSAAFFLSEAARADEVDLVTALLQLPAPPPPNPLMPVRGDTYPPEFFDRTKPPPDNAPIDDLIAYWQRNGSAFTDLEYQIKPSSAVTARLIDAIERERSLAVGLMKAIGHSRDGQALIKRIYDARGEDEAEYAYEGMRSWLKTESPYFADELEAAAREVSDTREYVNNHDDLLALGRQDWNRAAPIVARLYNDPTQPTSKVVAMWALYRQALDEDSFGDIERYRDELKAVVENRSATPGQRDLALDALTKEKEWPGRDDWYLTLLEDETLAELRINGSVFTGLTTIIYHTPKEKFRDKMIELLASSNKTVRNAAVRNLAIMLREPDEEIIKALLPWLKDPNWADVPNDNARMQLINALQRFTVPDAVPGLIALLDEKVVREVPMGWANSNSNSNVAYNAMNTAAAAANVIDEEEEYTAVAPAPEYRGPVNVVSNAVRFGAGTSVESYPHRYQAMSALQHQADPRAIPALRRMLNQGEAYERQMAIKAMLASGGFSPSEQVDALEKYFREMGSMAAGVANDIQELLKAEGIDVEAYERDPKSFDPELGARIFRLIMQNAEGRFREMSERRETPEHQLGSAVAETKDADDALVAAAVARIDKLTPKEPDLAVQMRASVRSWNSRAVNSLLMRDVKSGRGLPDDVLKLLAIRKELREEQSGEVFDMRGGVPAARAVSGCIMEDKYSLEGSLAAGGEEAAAALACARLVRVPLTLAKVAPMLTSQDKRLATAASLYLESEDSAEARMIVLSHNPGKAKVLGATHYFPGTDGRMRTDPLLPALFESVGAAFAYVGTDQESEAKLKDLQQEVLTDATLLGIYSYGQHSIRITQDGAVYRFQEDPARYKERVLQKEEFDSLKQYLAENEVGELKPFLQDCEECEIRELVMLGKAGGSRVYLNADRLPEFFSDLDAYFKSLGQRPMRLRYAAANLLPGLEVIYADDDHDIETVWKNGSDLRMFVTDREERKRAYDQFNTDRMKYYGSEYDGEEPETEAEAARIAQQREAARKEFEAKASQMDYAGVAWRGLADGRIGTAVQQPEGFYVPAAVDNMTVAADREAWKSRGMGVELRADHEGLYRVAGGRITKIRNGAYDSVVVSSDGRSALAISSDDNGRRTVRIDLAGRRDAPIPAEDAVSYTPIVYAPFIQRFVVKMQVYNYDHHDDGEGYYGDDFPPVLWGEYELNNSAYYLLDPRTGAMQKAPGEVRPLVQQTFRQLQQAGKAHEFWAAIPDARKNETVIGLYDAQLLGFKPLVTVPKMVFDSMDMWVDAAEGEAYFVYRGHLLAVPVGGR